MKKINNNERVKIEARIAAEKKRKNHELK